MMVNTDFEVVSDPRVKEVFQAYPVFVQAKMYDLRALVLEAAGEIPGLARIEETLKWGEPSYLTKQGSTLRMDWKAKNPHHYAMYFKCTSKLVPTFRLAFEGLFSFEGNRAILFSLEDEIPAQELRQCIKAALTYHRVKHLPLLGMG
ncbi:DUF1801 domain-containing protein [Algoriphagus halophytocola]|uniref:DUF1801 domain-containing protein n=1 Tax=Algoriphagus halophytocola TaxID=2991499 RepID=A0ABY6MK56_9BACT|nr:MULTISPECIES: DUF1801 domain-containing protein [unclassified Algoriphagus]UZD24162.1 DUF1801 domain-containing protein [Algoriphagus sp. TR-M5]WBL41533.1 DUF1801 domain-containing protein [Algoriphagus sp. TR-M9]